MELLEWSLDISKDTEMKAKIRRVQSMMTTFQFYFGCSMGELVLRQTDNLSRTLQNAMISAAQGQQLAEDVCITISRDRNDASFNLFWQRILQRKSNMEGIGDPELPRKRKAPARFEVGSGPHHFPSTAKEHFRQVYYEALDETVQ